jgi:fatty acid desaturase
LIWQESHYAIPVLASGIARTREFRSAMHVEATRSPSISPNTLPRLELPTLGVALAVHGGVFLLTAFFRELPLLLSAPLGSLLLAWYGSLQHETIHGHPTPFRRLNAVLGGLPLSLWIPYALYRETHLRHHRHGGRRLTRVEHDPESFYLPPGTLFRVGRLRGWIYRANCTLAGRLLLGPAIAITRFWADEFRHIWRGDRRRLRIWFRHAVGVGVVLWWTAGVCHISPVVYVALIVYPSVALSHLRSFAEHRDDVDPRLRTRVVEAHVVWALIFLNNNLHIAHHANPKLPWYQLPDAWLQMRQAAKLQGLVFQGGYLEVAQKYFFRPFINLDPDGT